MQITLSKQLGTLTYYLRTHNRDERASHLENVANQLVRYNTLNNN